MKNNQQGIEYLEHEARFSACRCWICGRCHPRHALCISACCSSRSSLHFLAFFFFLYFWSFLIICQMWLLPADYCVSGCMCWRIYVSVCTGMCSVLCICVHVQAQDPYHVSFLSYSPPYFETWFLTEPRAHVLTRPPDQHPRNPPPP